MSTTRFLSNDSLWSELRMQVKGAKSVKAAVAFVGSGGADLLPLKKGDTLVVNLAMQTVAQGLTSPKEIQRLQRRGVKVFTRSTLHAKFFLCGRTLLVGSANVSRNSQQTLDEAASLTKDPAAIRRAAGFFEQLCTEPVRPEYLKRCLRAYRPPKFGANGAPRSGVRQKRVIEAKLWFNAGLRYIETPRAEEDQVSEIEKAAEQKLRDPEKTEVTWTRFSRKLGFLDHIRIGDWVVSCIRDDDGTKDVHAPAQVLAISSYRRVGKKPIWLLVCESPINGTEMPLSEFRRKVRRIVPKLDSDRPRTMPVESVEAADAILGLWTANGRVRAKRKT